MRPLGFGTILGRSFTALRQNPRVLLGFALVVQTVATLVVTAAIVGASVFALSRLATLDPRSDEFDTVMAGSIALIGVVSIVLSLAAGALGVIVQGVVVSEVSHAVVAEKLTLGRVWRRVKPVAWRLVGYTLLVTLAIAVVAGVLVGLLLLLAQALLPLVIVLSVLLLIAAIPLWLWLTVKLLLVPATIVMEHATIRGAIVRSWVLTRGRFWSSLGIVVIVSLSFSFLAQMVSLPFSLVSVAVTSVLSPTGDPDIQSLIALIVGSLATQVVVLLIQAMALVVQATATALIYIDCRMRHEGLDLDLLAYVDQRDAGAEGLPDPYRAHIGRRIAPRGGFPPAGYRPPGHPAPGAFPGQSYPAPPVPYPGGIQPTPGAAQPPPGFPTPGQQPVDATLAPSPTRWTPPGGQPGPS
nr:MULTISPECIES: hypothetical protein [Microbacterium]